MSYFYKSYYTGRNFGNKTKNYTMQSKYYEYASLSSTNLEASSFLASMKGEESVFIRADYQYSGKGQGENKWHSEDKKNLLMSWIVFPAFLSVEDQFLLSKAVSLAIADFLGTYGLSPRIKWPNDILCYDGKIAGVLIENMIQGTVIKSSIIGIGLNINQEIFPDFPLPAISLKALLGKKFDIKLIFRELADQLERRYTMLEQGMYTLLNKEYLKAMYRLNEHGIFIDSEGEFEGKIQGVDQFGSLLLQVGNESRTYGFHEIKMKV